MTTLFTPINYYTLIPEPPMVGFDWDVSGLSDLFDVKDCGVSTPEDYGFPTGGGGSRNNYKNFWNWNEPLWQQLRNSLALSVPTLVKTLIDLDQQQNVNPWRWSTQSADVIAKTAVVDIRPVVDMDFGMNWHLDARNFFASGILNISENVPSTDFSRTREGEIYHTMDHRAGKGTVWLNTESNWHRLRKCPWPRKIVQFNITVVPFS